ncbi:MAG: DUF222 domain-containing protein [Candidatus Methylomirabilales bacterium]
MGKPAGQELEDPCEALEAEVTELAGHIAAATARQLSLIAELDRRDYWATWGCRSMAHWLSWKCGVDLAQAREQAKVAARLAELPAIKKAFERGELSYWKVRHLVKVSTADTEADFLELANQANAYQVERFCRAYRKALPVEDLEGDNLAHARRRLTFYFDEEEFLVLRGRLTKEAGAVFVAALQAAQDELWKARRLELFGTETPSGEVVVEVALSQRGEEAPPGNAWDQTGASYADALVLVCQKALAGEERSSFRADPHEVILHVDLKTLTGLKTQGGRCEVEGAGGIAPETARRISCDASVVTVIEDKEANPLSVGRRTRTIPPAIRRALRSRDRHCRFPGCSLSRFTEGHHLRHWAKGGETSLDNLMETCSFHHRLIHEGGFRVEKSPDGKLVFLRPDGDPVPDAPPLPRSRPGDLPLVHEQMGIDIGPETCVPDWAGDQLHLGYAVATFLHNHALRRQWWAEEGPAAPP